MRIVTELKELIYEGHLVPGYYINTNGELFSTRLAGTNRWNSHNKQLVCYGGEMQKKVGSVLRGRYVQYRIGTKFSTLDQTTNRHKGHSSKYRRILAHRAVMETFSPFEDNLPDDLVDEWPNLSETVKKYIRDGMTVDHIEDLDEGFNSLSNLQWMTRSDNASKGNRQPTPLEKLWN